MKKHALMLFISACVGLSVPAQTAGDKDQAERFVSLQAGTQATFTHHHLGKFLSPVVGVNAGGYYTPVVGTRFSLYGWTGKKGVRSLCHEAKPDGYNFLGTDVDMLFNLSNAFRPNRDHRFNVVFIAGLGMAWEEARRAQGGNVESGGFNFRGGFQFDYDLSRCLSLNLEVLGSGHHDKFNVKHNGKLDWQGLAMIGITYKWRKRTNRSNASSTLTQADYDASRNANLVVSEQPVVAEEPPTPAPPRPATPPAPKPEPAPVVVPPASTKAEIFFGLNGSDIRPSETGKLAAFAEWLKAHPKAKVKLTAYADAGTGNSTVNRAVSGRRAASVKQALVEKYGIAADRITTDFKGDTVQPFADNDRNRVTICVGEE